MKKRITVLLSGAALTALLLGGAQALASPALLLFVQAAAGQQAAPAQPGAAKQPLARTSGNRSTRV